MHSTRARTPLSIAWKPRAAMRGATAIALAILLVEFPSMSATAAGPSVGWQLALDIQGDLNGTASAPQVAMDNAGNAFAVWVQSNGTEAQVWANRFVVGSGWGRAAVIESVAGNASDPQVAADELGNAVAVWTQHDGVRDNVWASPFWVGYGWRAAALVESESGGFAQHPSVRMDRDGNAVVVWEQFDGAQYTVQANRLPLHQAWEAAAIVSANGAQRVFNPEVAVNVSGDALAVWTQSNGASLSVWGNRFVPGAGWGSAAPIQANATGDAYTPQIAVDITGNATAVWHEHNGTVNDIWACRYAVGAGWTNAMLIEGGAGNAVYPQVGVDKAGEALVVWAQTNGTQYFLAWNRFVPVSGWGNATLLTASPMDPQAPDVGVAWSGDAAAVWTHYDGVRYDVWAARYAEGAGWGNVTLIEADAGDAHTPSIGVDPSGIAVAVWTQHNGTRDNTRANRFEAPDTTPPSIHLHQPVDHTIPQTWSVYVLGATEPTARIAIDGIWDLWSPRPDGVFGDFNMGITVDQTTWSVTVDAMDASGNQATVTVGGNVYGGISGDLQNTLAGVQQALAAALDNATALQNSLNTTRLELTAAQANVTAARALVDQLEAQGNATQAALAGAQVNLTFAQAQVVSLQGNATAINASLAAVQADIATLNQRLLADEAGLADARAAANQSEANADASKAAASSATGQVGLALAAMGLGLVVGVAGLLTAARARKALEENERKHSRTSSPRRGR
jgi:hypothetical protein